MLHKKASCFFGFIEKHVIDLYKIVQITHTLAWVCNPCRYKILVSTVRILSCGDRYLLL